MSKVYLLGTGNYAKERLSAILASDRIGCDPDFISGMKATLKHEIDRYVDIRENDIDIQVKERMLIACIPLMCTRKHANDKDENLHTTMGQGLNNYESSEEEGCTELKTVQS